VPTEVFLFTDIEGSTRRWAEDAAAMSAALAVHDGVLLDAVRAAGGEVFKHTGDGFVARFDTVPAAVAGAVAGQRALAGADWGDDEALSARMAIHAGEAEARDADWFGPALNRCARLLGIGHGGQVLLSGAARALCIDGLPAGVGVTDLGRHRLRDLMNPEQVWQLRADGLRDTFPPLRSLDDRFGNLPIQLTGFLGRAAELAELAEAVLNERLVTLVGAGGMGKTRLALQVGAEVVDKFPDGVWLIELAPLQTGDGIDHAVAAALRLEPRAGVTPRDLVLQALLDWRALLVVDNCEHLCAEAAALVRDLLTRCPQLAVLATSREPLRIPGEQRWPIGPLDLDGSAVELFVQRASSVRHGFALDDADRSTVARVCRDLDGMPLAIELAASRMGSLTVGELAARLDRRFRLLSDARAGVAEPRHATLQAVVAWSYDLLEPVEQRLLCRMSVFAGSFDLDAVHQVCVVGCDDPDLDPDDDLVTLAAVDALVDRSLVIAEDHDGRTRFRLLETMRQWGDARLGDARPGLVDRHARHYVDVLRTARIETPDAIRSEVDNLRLAVDHALAAEDEALAFAIMRPLWRHVSASMSCLEAGQWAERALRLPGADDHPESFWAHLVLAAYAMVVADSARVVTEGRAAIAVEDRFGLTPSPYPRWWVVVGSIGVGAYDEAERMAREALEVAAPHQHSIRLEIVYQMLHIVAYRGDEPDAELLALWQEVGSHARTPLERFSWHYGQGVIAARQQPVLAAEEFDRALQALDTGGARHTIAGAARVYRGMLGSGDDPRAALEGMAEGLAYYRAARVAFGLRRMVRDFIPALAELGDHEAVAVIDGTAAPPVLRPALVHEAIARSRAALGDAYDEHAARGATISDDEIDRFLHERIRRHLST
jgi:predicted ATPase/class 3 adenylate cyclase